MIKLKELLSEHFWIGDRFDYPNFAKLSQSEKLDAAMRIITAPQAKALTGAEIYHVILSVPQDRVKALYTFSQQYLSPEQLADTKKQIDVFYK